MTIIPLFPTLIHSIEIKDFGKIQDQLIEFVYEQENNDPMGVIFSNDGGWQSRSNFQKDNIIADTIQNQLISYFANPDIFKSNFDLILSGLWLNINREGNTNRLHNHPGADLSGVFWIKVPKDCDSGKISFSSPHSYTDYISYAIHQESVCKELNFYDTYQFPPMEGTGYIFPAHLLHEVRVNRSRKDRISVSFNLNIRSRST